LRGSWSDTICVFTLLKFVPEIKVKTTRSVANAPHNPARSKAGICPQFPV
jgi:hypothetical protein